MKLSARNQFAGVETSVADGAVNGIVTLDVNGTAVNACITMGSIKGLGLVPGKKAYAVFKASEVMIGLGDRLALSARNQFPGTVAAVQKGAVNATVQVEALGGVISASITNASVDALGIAPGAKVLAVIKASSVMVGVDD